MTRDLNEKLGSVTPENLIAQLDPPALKKAGTVKRLGTSATLKRGTLMAKNAAGLLIVLGSDVDDTGTFSATGDGSKTTFEVIPGGDPTSVLTEVKVDGTATTAYTYHPVTGEIVFDSAPANTKAVAIKFTVGGGNADCILAEDIAVGTTAEENALVFYQGNFNEDALIVATGYTISEANKDELRLKNIILGASQTEKVTV